MDSRLLFTIALNVVITVAEAAGGLLAGSLAMLSDAAHNLGDVVAIVLAFAARKFGRRPATNRHTYGFKRAEVIGALLNALLLIVVTALIAREAVLRLLHPQPVAQGIMLVLGTIAFGANLGSALLLRKHDKHDANSRGAFLHMVQDACASLAVVVAALLANTKIGPYADAALALVVGILVLRGAFSLVRETISVILEGTPPDVDIIQLAAGVADTFAPAQLHHIHVWALGPSQRLLTAHVSLGRDMSGRNIEALLSRIKAFLHENWAINHSTLEPEVEGCSRTALLGHWEHAHAEMRPATM